jgi:hypothetical protein
MSGLDHHIHEGMTLYGVYSTLTEHYRPGRDPRDTDPRDLLGVLAQHGRLRCACLVVAHCYHLLTPGSRRQLFEADALVGEVTDLIVREGRRPRFLAELGLSMADLLDGER